MHRPVMPATERDRELIADLAAECAGLGEAQVVGIRGLAAAHETCLLGGFEWARVEVRGEDLSHCMN
jgi:hypothetical protein